MLDRQRRLIDERGRMALAATVALLGFWLGWPGAARLAVQLAAVVVASLVVVAAIRRFVEARAPAAASPPGTGRLDPIAVEYARLRRQVELAMQPETGLDAFLVRELREIVGQLLLGHGVELKRDPKRARRLVGDEVWELIRPGHRIASVGGRDLVRVLDRLEAL